MTDTIRNLAWKARSDAEKAAYREGFGTGALIMGSLAVVLGLVVVL